MNLRREREQSELAEASIAGRREPAVREASFSHDEKEILFSSDQTGVRNVYSVPVTGGPARALTTGPDTTTSVSYFPRDARFFYTRDQGGNELHHLYVREKDGTERDLTPGAKLKANFVGWSDDRKSFTVPGACKKTVRLAQSASVREMCQHSLPRAPSPR